MGYIWDEEKTRQDREVIQRSYRGQAEVSRGHTEVKQRSNTGQTEVKQRSCRGHAEVMQRSYRGHTEVIQRSYRGHTEVIQWSFKGHLGFRGDIERIEVQGVRDPDQQGSKCRYQMTGIEYTEYGNGTYLSAAEAQ